MNNQELKTYIKESAQRDKNDEPVYTYTEMLVYNDLETLGKIGPGLTNLSEVYDKLYGFGLSLSGYQFIGLILEKSFFDGSNSPIYPFAYFMLGIGFIVSLFGALLSFCMYQFLTYAKNESDEYIVKGIIEHREAFKLPHNVLLVNTFCFALPINILIHTNLELVYGIIFNVMSVLLLASGFPIHRKMVSKKAEFALSYIDKDD